MLKQLLSCLLSLLLGAEFVNAQTVPEAPTESVTVNGIEREWRMFVPPSYQAGTEMPLVIDFHGSGSSPDREAGLSQFEALASDDYRRAFLKSQIAAGNVLPQQGTVFLSVRDEDKGALTDVARRLRTLGFHLLATRGTAAALRRVGIMSETVNKVAQGSPHVVERIEEGGVQMVINTTSDAQAVRDSFSIRRERRIPCSVI